MKKPREFKANPPTPLNNWSVEVDPAIMSGDHWLDEELSPLEEIDFLDDDRCADEAVKKEHPYDLFMHQTINVSYGNSKRLKKKK